MLPTVTTCEADVVLVFTLPNARVVGVKVACGAATAKPITARVTSLVVGDALVMKCALAVRAPVAAGVIATFTVQFCPGMMVAPVQLSALSVTSPLLVPVAVTLVTVKFAVPLLVNWMVRTGVDIPCVTEPKSMLDGIRVTAGAVA